MLFWGLSVLLCKQFATFIGDTDSLCFKPLLILRMKFVLNIFTAKAFICGGYICIDGFLKKNICLVQVGAVVWVAGLLHKPVLNRFKPIKWRVFGWRNWRYSNRVPKIFWLSKKNISATFLEVNYILFAGVLLRRPAFGEILVSSKRRMLSNTILKKVYYIY